MLYLKRDIVNNVVYTAHENIATIESQFLIELENQQSLLKVSATLNNATSNVLRYDMSYIVIPTATTMFVTYSGSTTYIHGLTPGYYNYTISNVSNTTVLEIGKCLVEYIPQTITTYTPANNTIVYEPKN